MTLRNATAAIAVAARIAPFRKGWPTTASIANGATVSNPVAGIRVRAAAASITCVATIAETASTFPFLQFLLHRVISGQATGRVYLVGADLSVGVGKYTS